MTLFDTTAYLVLASEASPSLPDPTTVIGRTHSLVNLSSGTATWTAPGATPFLVSGVAVANLTVPAGGSAEVQSDGTRWALKSAADPTRRIFAATATTNASGIATFTFSPAFAVAPVVSAGVQTALGTNGHFCEVTSVSTSGCTVQGWQGRNVVLGLNTTIESGAGIVVHLLAMDAGQGV